MGSEGFGLKPRRGGYVTPTGTTLKAEPTLPPHLVSASFTPITKRGENPMAKGSMRPGKEARKPKKDAKAKGAAAKEAAAPVIAIRAKKTEK